MLLDRPNVLRQAHRRSACNVIAIESFEWGSPLRNACLVQGDTRKIDPALAARFAGQRGVSITHAAHQLYLQPA